MAALEEYKQIIKELQDTYERKNHDYGDSFAILYEKYGLKSTVIRLWDKVLRLETLSEKGGKVEDESIEDTLLDLANYAIMTVAERRRQARGEEKWLARKWEAQNGFMRVINSFFHNLETRWRNGNSSSNCGGDTR